MNPLRPRKREEAPVGNSETAGPLLPSKWEPTITKVSADERFWRKVKKSDNVLFGAACWEWTASRFALGYGKFKFEGKNRLAHRFSYEHLVGPIPEGLTLDHLCRNRGCVNPKHLEPVTMKENLHRGQSIQAINARKAYCKRGHEFTPENTYYTIGGRNCRTCRREATRVWRLSKTTQRKVAI